MQKKGEEKKMMQNISMLKVGQLIEGKIIEIGKDTILLDLGPYKTGLLLGRELKENRELLKTFKPGDALSVMVVDPENEDGYVELSLREAYYKKSWEALRELKDGDFPLKVKITQANRGGLVISARGIVGFLPVSQLSSEHYPYVDGEVNRIVSELNKFVNQELEVKIIDLDEHQQKFIVSEKALEERKMREIMDKYKVGEIIEGEVSGIADFGAFVKVPVGDANIEGLIHIAELDWQLVEDPRQIVKVGEQVKAKILGIDGNRLLLSLKALKKDPWDDIADKYKKGDTIKGKIVKFHPFGAFVEIGQGIYGLIHVSEFENIEKAKEALSLGKKYNFKITFFNPPAHKMTLTLADKSHEA